MTEWIEPQNLMMVRQGRARDPLDRWKPWPYTLVMPELGLVSGRVAIQVRSLIALCRGRCSLDYLEVTPP